MGRNGDLCTDYQMLLTNKVSSLPKQVLLLYSSFMKIIISPAKNMSMKADSLEPAGLPVFLDKAQILVQHLKSLSFPELKTLLACNDEIARLNYERYRTINLSENTNPALVTYEGIQYKYMAPRVFTYDYFDYAQKYLRILSGLYGVLKPLDGIVPYRLEMQAKLKTDFCKNLYDFWGADIYKNLTLDDDDASSKVILNLASEEYAKAVRKFVKPTDTFITCTFAEQVNGSLKEKGVYVKMARGEMVRFMAENNITKPEDIKAFTGLGYRFSPKDSREQHYVFIR